MKRTIAALFALGSLAVGDTMVNVMQTGNTGMSASTTGIATTDVWGATELNLTNVEVTVEITKPVNARNAWTTNYATSVFTINGTNVGQDPGGTFTYTLTFTTDFADGVNGVSLDSLTFDIFTLNQGGNTQNEGLKQIAYSCSLKLEESILASASGLEQELYSTGYAMAQGGTAAYTHNSDGTYSPGTFATAETTGGSTLLSGGQMTVDFGEPLMLEDHTTYSLTMDIERASRGDFYLGFGNVAFNGKSVQPTIPEPAATSLSILALAGLATRRRRTSL